MSGGKAALITGVSGQDGAYLARLLLDKGYRLFGCVRDARGAGLERLDALGVRHDVRILEIDLTDRKSIQRAIEAAEPDEIYNLAAQSSVAASFHDPAGFGISSGIVVANILEAMREAAPSAHFYQASSSEMFGSGESESRSEQSPFHPQSPYAVAKLYGHWITINYRQSHGLHATSGILFNHESPLRDARFVTRKITKAVAAIYSGAQEDLLLGNLEAVRDWGHARDYVEGMWLMLQQPKADDYILATGVGHSVRQFVEAAFSSIDVDLEWSGSAKEEVGIDRRTGKVRVKVDAEHFRPSEVTRVIGNPAKARARLGWESRTDFRQLVDEMVHADLQRLQAGSTG